MAWSCQYLIKLVQNQWSELSHSEMCTEEQVITSIDSNALDVL